MECSMYYLKSSKGDIRQWYQSDVWDSWMKVLPSGRATLLSWANMLFAKKRIIWWPRFLHVLLAVYKISMRKAFWQPWKSLGDHIWRSYPVWWSPFIPYPPVLVVYQGVLRGSLEIIRTVRLRNLLVNIASFWKISLGTKMPLSLSV